MDILHKTVRHFFPDFSTQLKRISDPRSEPKIVYPLPYLVWVGILLFLLKLGARRQIHHLLNEPSVVTHLNALTGECLEEVPHGDTLECLMQDIDYAEVAEIRTAMVRKLIRSRVLDNYRLLGEYHRIAIDGSGIMSFAERHCEHCLTKTSSVTEKTTYYHTVLEAKLVTDNGLSLSVATEFIENPGKNVTKQDCERKAFYRLAPHLKKAFPQLPICLLLDALYAVEPVMEICEKYHWQYLINFKSGSMPAKYEEFVALCESVQKMNKLSLTLPDHTRQEYQFATKIEHKNHLFNAIRCLEHKPDTKSVKQYAYMTNLLVTHNTCAEIANQGGRNRWKIENQGFNIQKNGGYNLEHMYSKNVNAGKVYYILLQIAHIFNQLIEKGSLIAKKAKSKIGSIRNIARLLLESIRTSPMTKEKYNSLFVNPFQIRLNSS